MKKPHTVPGFVIYGFLVLGLLSAVAFRAIIILQHLQPAWVRPAWYAGVLGYVGFFLYRYVITKKRKGVIKDFELIEKVQANACLSAEDREVIIYLLSSIQRSREDINYLVIFLLSILAILIDLVFTLYS